jgi:multisubunit Na+/H+ antiporter MnhG subunit
MSSPVADILIWVLLAAGVGFGILGFVGLLIFPEIRSRMFTASRATLISISLVSLAVIVFGINGFLGGGGDQYAALVIHTIFLLGVCTISNVFISRIILEKAPDPCRRVDDAGAVQDASGNRE